MPKLIEKKWGREIVWAHTSHYTGKLLDFDAGASGSEHFHGRKDESWFVLGGRFHVVLKDPATGLSDIRALGQGDTIHLPPCTVHKLICIEAGTIVEVSTPHDDADTIRIAPSEGA